MKTAEETLIEHTSNGWFREGSIAAMQAYAEQAVKLALDKVLENGRVMKFKQYNEHNSEVLLIGKFSFDQIIPTKIIQEIETIKHYGK